MMDPAHKRYALVTGGGSGLGRAFCRRLAGDGWQVACADIDLPAAQQTVAEAREMMRAETLDVTDAAAWTSLRDKLQSDWPRLDLLVNNAGICAAGEIGDAPLEDFEQVIEVNLRGTLLGCHMFTPWLRVTAPGGQIVNIASIAGVLSPPAMGAYSISKAGVIALSETLYAELRPLGIGVTVVMPGFFASELVNRGAFATDRQRQMALRYTRQAQITADEVVEQTLRAVRRRKLYAALGSRARWLWRMKRLAGTTLLNLMSNSHDRTMRKSAAD